MAVFHIQSFFFSPRHSESHEVATHQQRLRQELFHAMHFCDFFPNCRAAKEIFLQLRADTYSRVPQLGFQPLPFSPWKGASPGEPRRSRRLLPCLQRRALSSLLLALLPGARGSFEADRRSVRGCHHSTKQGRTGGGGGWRRRAVLLGSSAAVRVVLTRGLVASFCSLELHLDSPKQHGMAAFIAMLKKQYFKIPIVYSICSQTE